MLHPDLRINTVFILAEIGVKGTIKHDNLVKGSTLDPLDVAIAINTLMASNLIHTVADKEYSITVSGKRYLAQIRGTL